MAGIDFIQDLAVVMLVAGVAGWMCQQVGLSVVVGYILAGVVIGPFTPPFPLVGDVARVQTLADVGLVFLMFSIGMGLSLKRLRRMGLPVLIATMVGAFVIFNVWRGLAVGFGLTEIQGLFLAGMLVCSSSAIIGKILQETGTSHSKFGQLALGVTVLEDMVAIVVLTILVSYAGIGEGGQETVWEALGLFGAFVVFLVVTGLLLLPRLLGFLSRRAATEIQTLVIGALLLGLALMAYRAGYSLALGAFLMGVVVAETEQRAQVERTFEGLLHLFSAVFFVAIGMLIDVSVLPQIWLWIILLSVGTIVTRTFSISLALLLMGNPTRDCVRAGLSVTPLGEFSFIIAQAGIAALVLPASFYPLAVGVSLLTALSGTLLIKHSGRISDWVVRVEPRPVRRYLEWYQVFLNRLAEVERESHLWLRSRRSLMQIGIGLFFIVGLLIPAELFDRLLVKLVGADFLFANGTAVIFWTVLVAVLSVPVAVVWQNILRLGSIVETSLRERWAGAAVIPGAVSVVIKGIGAAVLAVMLAALLPLGGLGPWVFLLILVAGGIAALTLRRRFVGLHEHFDTEMEGIFGQHGENDETVRQPWLNRPDEWKIEVKEVLIPDMAACAGETIGQLGLRKRFGGSIVGIDRHGYLIANPGPQTALFPGDRVLLLGNSAEIGATREVLETSDGKAGGEIGEVSLEAVPVPKDSPRATKSLRELDISRTTGVQIAGINRGGTRTLNPTGESQIEEGDELLVLGTPVQVREFRRWMLPVLEDGQRPLSSEGGDG